MEAKSIAANSVNTGKVWLTSTPESTHVLRGTGVSKTHVLLQVKTGHIEEEQARRPLNLALVLDRSGSMSGEKLENAKKSIIEVIQNLLPSDILHLVCYGSKIETILENADLANREHIITQVNAIKTEGCTNMWAGIERGVQLLVEHSKPGVNSRLFLFSDGLVNEGVKDKTEIQKRISEDVYEKHSIQVSAFGIGKDFDEDLMRGIAERGLGAYFFIEGPQTIPEFVAFALKFVLKMVGIDSVIHIGGVGSNIVTKIFGQEDIVNGVKLGDLRAENTRSLMVELEVGRECKAESAEVLYYDLLFKNNEEENVKMSGSSVLHFTDDAAEVEKGKSPEVEVKVVVLRTTEIDKRLVKLMDGKDDGDDDEEEEEKEDNEEDVTKYKKTTKKAIRLQKKQIAMLEEVLKIDEEQLRGENRIKSLLESANKRLQKLKKEGMTESTRKDAQHRQYTVSRG